MTTIKVYRPILIYYLTINQTVDRGLVISGAVVPRLKPGCRLDRGSSPDVERSRQPAGRRSLYHGRVTPVQPTSAADPRQSQQDNDNYRLLPVRLLRAA